jgi:hypothetical protein
MPAGAIPGYSPSNLVQITDARCKYRHRGVIVAGLRHALSHRELYDGRAVGPSQSRLATIVSVAIHYRPCAELLVFITPLTPCGKNSPELTACGFKYTMLRTSGAVRLKATPN